MRVELTHADGTRGEYDVTEVEITILADQDSPFDRPPTIRPGIYSIIITEPR